MSKPGDVVEFKSGLFGIDAPANLAILLDRWRKKGVPWVRIMTMAGMKEAKAGHLSRRVFRDRYTGSLQDEGAVLGRLKVFLQAHSSGSLQEEAEDDLGRLEEQLWEATKDGNCYEDEALAGKLYPEPSPQQLRDVKAALERCRRPGVGRFEVQAKGNEWRPWTEQEVQTMRQGMEQLAALRQQLVAKIDTPEESYFEAQDADFDALDQETLAWVQAAMVQFIEHDGVPDRDIAGIGGLGATNAFGMDLHRNLGFLAMDWAGSGANKSSDYIQFLLKSGLWQSSDAVESLIKRHVNQVPYFEHALDLDAATAAEALPEPAAEEGREDIRHLDCFTIDPPDAKDFDDAVGVEDITGGKRLWVHIADVSSYVTPGTLLDRHARTRATSVYLPGRVLPMLPHRIADYLCSLRSDGDRHALSVAMDVIDGKVVATKIHIGLIRVNENLAYGDALTRRDEEPFASLFALADQMRQHRMGMDLDLAERRVQLEDTGFSLSIKKANEATMMIETFMVAANEAVARFLHDNELEGMYRCHPVPERKALQRASEQWRTMDMPVLPTPPESTASEPSLMDMLAKGGKLELLSGGLADEPEAPSDPTTFAGLEDPELWLGPIRAALESLDDVPEGRREVASLKLLQAMPRAYYGPEPNGHFGLGLRHYLHFTSPIRRYPDLLVHRNVKAFLRGEKTSHDLAELERYADHCSNQEEAADNLERTVRNACLTLASNHTTAGETRITTIRPSGIFVRFQDGLEARVAMRALPGAPYEVDEWESMLFRFTSEGSLREWFDEELGETRYVRARIGDVVHARPASRDVANGKLEARIEQW